MSNMITNILKASQCVFNWLGYLSKASDNSTLIAESSLKYPFVECLERHSINDVHLEFLHPLFQRKKIDAYIGNVQDNDIIDENSPKMIFIEFKFVRGDTLSVKEQQRYFNDILRLSCLKHQYPNSETYFLVCGETVSFNNAFQYKPQPNANKKILADGVNEKRTKKKSIYNDWLSFNMKFGKKEQNLAKMKYKKFVSSFNDEYKIREGVSSDVLNLNLNTQLKLLLPSKNTIDNSYSLGLWEIL